MELYKLRYNLYNYLIHNTINYDITVANKKLWFYFLISYYTFFIFLLIATYKNINISTIIFIVVGIFFLYYCYLLNISLTNIIDNSNFLDYVSLYKLLNAIFIESYKNNNVNNLITDINDSEINLTLQNILDSKFTAANDKIEITPTSTYDKNNREPTIFSNTRLIYNTPIINQATDDDNYIYLKYTTGTYTLNLYIDLNCDILVIGGGGSGGNGQGGGGGAGALIYKTNYTIAKGVYTITIGDGGAIISDPNASSSINGFTGADTEIIRSNNTPLFRAKGGGGGGGNMQDGLMGGSSGGSSTRPSISKTPSILNEPPGEYGTAGGIGTGYQGDNLNKFTAGGGGGAGTRAWYGIDGKGGYGGLGKMINITGSSVYYAAGGGGGVNQEADKPGNGGNGIGGNGGKGFNTIIATSGAVNTGSGGGGAGRTNNFSGNNGAGGSGVVIIRLKKQVLTIGENNIITINENITNIIKKIKIIANPQYEYLLIIIQNKNEHYFINKLTNDNIYNKLYYKLDKTKVANTRVYMYGDFYLIDISDEAINDKKNYDFYKYLVEYLNYKFRNDKTTKKNTKITTLQTKIVSTNTNPYLNSFYNTLTNIQTTIKYNENISIHDINKFIDDAIKDRNILKYIDIYDSSYDYLKKSIYIKNDSEDTIYKYINDNYETNKDKNISMISTDTTKIQDVITKITDGIATTILYYIIDIETINGYLNDKDKDTNHINQYIATIYNMLIDNYNTKYDLNISNFDILYKDNKKIDLIIKEKVNIYIYLFNIILAIIIIILTIIMHAFFIYLYNPIQGFA